VIARIYCSTEVVCERMLWDASVWWRPSADPQSDGSNGNEPRSDILRGFLPP
jgi:hypothetical protein